MFKLYIKKPIPVEVIQYLPENEIELGHWSNGKVMVDYYNNVILISTLEGVMTAVPGSYVIKGSEGEFWAVKQSIFEKTYYEHTDEDGILYDSCKRGFKSHYKCACK